MQSAWQPTTVVGFVREKQQTPLAQSSVFPHSIGTPAHVLPVASQPPTWVFLSTQQKSFGWQMVGLGAPAAGQGMRTPVDVSGIWGDAPVSRGLLASAPLPSLPRLASGVLPPLSVASSVSSVGAAPPHEAVTPKQTRYSQGKPGFMALK